MLFLISSSQSTIQCKYIMIDTIFDNIAECHIILFTRDLIRLNRLLWNINFNVSLQQWLWENYGAERPYLFGNGTTWPIQLWFPTRTLTKRGSSFIINQAPNRNPLPTVACNSFNPQISDKWISTSYASEYLTPFLSARGAFGLL